MGWVSVRSAPWRSGTSFIGSRNAKASRPVNVRKGSVSALPVAMKRLPVRPRLECVHDAASFRGPLAAQSRQRDNKLDQALVRTVASRPFIIEQLALVAS